MRIPRFYQNSVLNIGDQLILNGRISHHLSVVLRTKLDDCCLLFNNDGFEYLAKIVVLHKKKSVALVYERQQNNVESPLKIHLAQVISANQKMDHTLQKATEMGVNKITPIINQKNAKRWSAGSSDKITKKMQHFENIVISATEQSGRVKIPVINPVIDFNTFIEKSTNGNRYILDGSATQSLSKQKPNKNVIIVLVGAESGFCKADLTRAISHHFVAIKIGPRTLRTETVAPVILALMQNLWGDI